MIQQIEDGLRNSLRAAGNAFEPYQDPFPAVAKRARQRRTRSLAGATAAAIAVVAAGSVFAAQFATQSTEVVEPGRGSRLGDVIA